MQGQVVNWTEGGGNVSRIEVILDSYQGNSYLGSTTATTDGNGTFEFTGLATEADYVYQLSLAYQEAEYSFEWFSFDEGVTDKTIKLVVYDSTLSDQFIGISRAHAIINVGAEDITVTEWYQFSNDGNKTYIGSDEAGLDEKKTLEFSVPEQAADIQLGGDLAEWGIVYTEDGFADTMMFFPGTKEMTFTYSLDFTSESYDIPLTFHYPVASFDLMVGGQYVEVECDRLAPAEPLDSGGEQFARFIGQDLDSETTLDIHLSGLVVYDSTSSDQFIRISRAHAIIQVEPDALTVTEMYQFSNDGDEVYIGSEEVGPGTRRTLEFSLPEEATFLELGGEFTDWTIVETEDGFADTAILFSGTKDVSFTYRLDYTSDTYNLPLTLYYPVASFDLMVGGKYAEVECDNLFPADPIGSGSEQYTHFIGQTLDRDTTLDVQLSGLLSSGKTGLPPGVIAAIVMAHVAGLTFVILKRRRRKAGIPVSSGEDVILAEKDILLREIADLDDSFERGDISEEDYSQLRSEKKSLLTKLMRGK